MACTLKLDLQRAPQSEENFTSFIKSKKDILTPMAVHRAGRGWSAKIEHGQLHLGHTLQPEVGLFLGTGGDGWSC